jgi:hypothetical protein
MACRHIKPNGLRYKSPAMRGPSFCYFHAKVHSFGAEPNAKFGNLQLPPPEAPAAIQLSVARIADAVINGRLDLKKANNLLYGLQIALQFIDRKNFFYAPDAVQSAEQDSQGNELAPDQYVCKDKDDCNDCPCSDACPRCVPAGDDEDDED